MIKSILHLPLLKSSLLTENLLKCKQEELNKESNKVHPKYRGDIDGLRAIAVLSVLIYHLNNSWLAGGFLGVDIFFVISGFLITKIIAGEVEKGTFSFSNFYARRIRRIFPALFVVLIFSGIAAYLSLPKEEYSSFFGDFKYASAQIANIHFNREVEYMGVGVEASPLLHTWSLGVEEQFYLVWPLLLFALFKVWGKKAFKPFALIFFIASLALCEYFLSISDSKQAFYMFYSRAYELVIGAFVALHMIPEKKSKAIHNSASIIGAALIVYSLFFISEAEHFPGLTALIPSIGAMMVIYAGKEAIINKLIANKFFIGIGLISYSLYLWHWPLISFTTNFTREALTYTQAATIFVLSITLAYLSWRYVERPFRHSPIKADYMSWKPHGKVIGQALLLIIVFIVGGNYIRTHADDLGRGFNNPMLAKAFSKERYQHQHCTNGEKQPTEATDPQELINCTLGNTIPDVLLFGDSHGLYQRYLIEAWAKEQNLTFTSLAIPACGMFVGDYAYVNEKGDKKSICSKFTRKLVRHINQSEKQPKFIFIANRMDHHLKGATNDNSTFEVQGFMDKPREQRIRALIKNTSKELAQIQNTQTIFIGQAPVLNGGPSVCLERHESIPLFKWFVEPQACPTKIEGDLQKEPLAKLHAEMAKDANNYPNVHFFGITPYFTHLYDDKGNMLYHDDDHISRFGALHLLNPLKEFMASK